jgi:membrane protein implicated in regulation of membrane protease activity
MWFWIFIAIAAAIGEVLTVDLFLASVAVAAVGAAIASLVFGSLVIQIVLFTFLSLVGIGVVRPAVKHALGIDPVLPADLQVRQSHVLGRQAVVTQTVSAHEGQIRIGQGEFWSARAFDPQESIPVGTRVEVLLVEGISALVAPVTLAPQLESTIADQKGT